MTKEQLSRKGLVLGGSDWTLGNLFLTVRVVKHWKRLPSMLVDAPSLSVFEALG